MTERTGPLPTNDYRPRPDVADWEFWTGKPVNHFETAFHRWWFSEEDRLSNINPTWPMCAGTPMHVSPIWPDNSR